MPCIACNFVGKVEFVASSAVRSSTIPQTPPAAIVALDGWARVNVAVNVVAVTALGLIISNAPPSATQTSVEVVMFAIDPVVKVAGVTVTAPGAATVVPRLAIAVLTGQLVPVPVIAVSADVEVVIAEIEPALIVPAFVLIRNLPAPCVLFPCVTLMVSDDAPVVGVPLKLPWYSTLP